MASHRRTTHAAPTATKRSRAPQRAGEATIHGEVLTTDMASAQPRFASPRQQASRDKKREENDALVAAALLATGLGSSKPGKGAKPPKGPKAGKGRVASHAEIDAAEGEGLDKLHGKLNPVAAGGANRRGVNQSGMGTNVLHAMEKSAGGVSKNGLTISVSDAKDLVGHMFKAIAANPGMARIIPSLFLWGPPGVGKSSVLENMCLREFGVGHVDFRLSELEPVDVRGMNLPDMESGRLKLVIPDEYPDPARGDPKYGINVFDELSAVGPSMQVSAYRIINERNLGKAYKVPESWYQVACGNTKDDKAVSYTMSSALANRFCHIEIHADPESLISHLSRVGQGDDADLDLMKPEEKMAKFEADLAKYKVDSRDTHPDVVGYLRFSNGDAQDMNKGNPERGWPSGRSWQRASIICKLADKGVLNDHQCHVLVQGLVGPGVAGKFMAFRKVAAELPNAKEVLMDNEKAKNFKMPEDSDKKYAFVSNIIYHLFRTKDEEENKKMVNNFIELLCGPMKHASDFAAMAIREGLAKSSDQKNRLMVVQHPRFIKEVCKMHLNALNPGDVAKSVK